MSYYCETSKPFRGAGFSDGPGGRSVVFQRRKMNDENIIWPYKRRVNRTGPVWGRGTGGGGVYNVFGHRLVQLSDPSLRPVFRQGHYIIIMYGLWVRPLCFSDVPTRIIHDRRPASRRLSFTVLKQTA